MKMRRRSRISPRQHTVKAGTEDLKGGYSKYPLLRHMFQPRPWRERQADVLEILLYVSSRSRSVTFQAFFPAQGLSVNEMEFKTIDVYIYREGGGPDAVLRDGYYQGKGVLFSVIHTTRE